MRVVRLRPARVRDLPPGFVTVSRQCTVGSRVVESRLGARSAGEAGCDDTRNEAKPNRGATTRPGGRAPRVASRVTESGGRVSRAGSLSVVTCVGIPIGNCGMDCAGRHTAVGAASSIGSIYVDFIGLPNLPYRAIRLYLSTIVLVHRRFYILHGFRENPIMRPGAGGMG